MPDILSDILLDTSVAAPSSGVPQPLSDYGSWGDPRDPKFGQNLTTIQTPGGVKFTVNKGAANAFTGFLSELEGLGYNIDQKTSGGYNLRNITGGTTLSPHAYGLAVDINPSANPYSSDPNKRTTDLPPNVGQIANKYGLSWGGDWKNLKDPMHFEYTGQGPYQVAGREATGRSGVNALGSGSVGAISSGIEQADQRAFFQRWGPYAAKAGNALGVDPNVILGQWAHESNYGRSDVAKTTGNLGGITQPKGGYASYSSPQDFTDAYVETLKKYPNATGTGSDIGRFVAGLSSDPQHRYFTGNPGDYGKSIATIASTNPMGMTSASPYNQLTSYGGTDISLRPREYSGPQLQLTEPPNPLAVKQAGASTPPPPDLSGMIAMAMIQKMVPSTHTLHPVEYDPFKAQVRSPVPQAQAEPFGATREAEIKTGTVPQAGTGPQIQAPRNIRGVPMSLGSRVSIPDLFNQVTGGGTGSPSLRRGVG